MFVMIDPDDTGDFAADVARRLRLTRVALGYSDRQQNDFAAESGIAQSHYNKFEGGSRLLTLNVAMKLCHRWGLTLDWLFRGDPSGLPYKLANDIKELRRAEREKRSSQKTIKS
jgi:transcriptional regulator with XRE-family HTH domain